MAALKKSEHFIKWVLLATDLAHGESHMFFRLHLTDSADLAVLIEFLFFFLCHLSVRFSLTFWFILGHEHMLTESIFLIRCENVKKFRGIVNIMLITQDVNFLLSEAQLVNK